MCSGCFDACFGSPFPNGSFSREIVRSASKIAALFQIVFEERFSCPSSGLVSIHEDFRSFPAGKQKKGTVLPPEIFSTASRVTTGKVCACEFAGKREFRRAFVSFRSFPAFAPLSSGNGDLIISADSPKIMNWRKSALSAVNSRSPDFVFETEI